MGAGDPPLGRQRAVRLPGAPRRAGRVGDEADRIARPARLCRGGGPGDDPDHAGRPRLRRSRARGDARAGRRAGPVGDVGDARVPLGVVLGADPRGPVRLRAVPAPGGALARRRARARDRLTYRFFRFLRFCGWWWPGSPSGVSSFSRWCSSATSAVRREPTISWITTAAAIATRNPAIPNVVPTLRSRR